MCTRKSIENMFRPRIHSEDGRYWAEIPAMPGCFTVADTLDELRGNLIEAAQCWLLTSADMENYLADVEPGRLVGDAALVCVAFRAEFVRLALDVCQPRVDGDEVVFECRDPLAAKERAKALKRPAARVDEFEDVNDVSNAHALIIAYFGGLAAERGA